MKKQRDTKEAAAGRKVAEKKWLGQNIAVGRRPLGKGLMMREFGPSWHHE